MLKNLLFYRLVILNALGGVGLAVGYWMGLLQQLFERDPSGITIMISCLFGLGFTYTFWRGWRVTRWLNRVKTLPRLASWERKAIKKLPSKSLLVSKIGTWCVTLGLIGNALAFFLAVPLDGDNEAISTALRHAMPIAFGTTLWGTVLMLWSDINYHMLDAATLGILEDIKLDKE